MHTLIESRRQEVAECCRRRGASRPGVFGSVSRADFDEVRGDLVFLAQFDRSLPYNPLDAYFGLKDDLASMSGRAVDLMSVGSVKNPYVQASIERDRQLAFAA